ncbi:acetyl-CoA carboxylase carboxyl transferase subunit beta [Candidatus Gastranaerophilus sp. (ex Termes propinquus)]|nr:acetyl-CoA carboxylase carboxyl transferase subunit beta [Candidatus Gastranaerophilus sp. (ex Termes propinquus)]
MTLTDWFKTRRKEQIAARGEVKIDDAVSKLWTSCYNCSAQLPKKDLEASNMVCPNCDYHFRLGARERIELILDEGTFKEKFTNILGKDPLEFVDTQAYATRQEQAKEKTGLDEAVIVGTGKIHGHKVAMAVMDFEYMGGSMGSVVGEKVTRMMELAIEKKIPMIAFTSSGGARMQESALSLMQMAKTACAVAKLNEAKILYITVLCEPTFGGVTASFGTLGDFMMAEKGARIGFAGRRVIEQTIKQKLPPDFQTAEYLLKYGQLDAVVERREMKDKLGTILSLHAK